MYLDLLSPLRIKVGYGQLGLHGNLGYEGKQVLVQGKPYQHALSTHPAARLLFHLGGGFTEFRCQVAINDDVHPGVSQADFAILADGHKVAHAPYVVAGEPPRTLTANIRGVQSLELVVETSRWDFCHAVWLDPEVDWPDTVGFSTPVEALTYLDALPLCKAEVGYGTLGLHGSLGYEDKTVKVQGRRYDHSLSTHPPARLLFKLDGRFTKFGCEVAINDDVSAGPSHAHFSVRADGRQVAAASFVVAGEPPHTLSADISGAQELELIVRTSRWEYCHAVWLDPQVDVGLVDNPASTLLDCLGRAKIMLPTILPPAERCIATVVSPGFEALLDDMLGSLHANSGCQDALVVVFAIDPDEGCQRVAAKYGATLIRCTHRASINAAVKSVLYSVARVIDANQFLCLDADMLVLGDLRPVFTALEACPEGTILACREANGPSFSNLEHALCSVYGGRTADVTRLLGKSSGEATYPLVVNDGIFAGSRTALLALDGLIRRWSQAPTWVDERRDIWWRNQFVFNLALAHLDCGVELNATYNIQLNFQEAKMREAEGRVQALWRGQMVQVLHFNGLGRYKYPEWRGLFAQVEAPLVGTGAGDGYANIRGAGVAPAPEGRKAVLFLSGFPGVTKRYRCDHQAEQLHLLGATCDAGLDGQMNLSDALGHYQCFVLHRVPYGPDVQQLITRARSQGKPVIFDTDDWVFDPAAMPYLAVLDAMTEDQRALFKDSLDRYRTTLLACDAVLVTTERLRDLAGEIHSNVFVCPNGASQQMVEQADAALLKKRVDERNDRAREEVTIAYLSGTPTHNRDFLEAADAVLCALETYSKVKFQAVGYIDLDPRFIRFGKRVERIPLQPWQYLPEILAQVDINLAPLERENPFTDCKSCLKYIEAGLLGVPTIASPCIDFRRVIDPGRNGLLADTPQEWKQALLGLIESPQLRREMGRRAYADVRRNHLSQALAPALYETIQTISGAMKRSDPLTVNWILRAPIAGPGGGYRTIFRLADYLANRGHVVRMYVEPIAHLAHLAAPEICTFLEEHFGPLRVQVFVGHEHILPADASIATNWPTAYHVAEHSESLFKFYFVQDFEPEFYETSDPLYQQAERTYSLPLHHVCIGRYLGNRISGLTGKPTDVIDFAVDLDMFHMSVRPEDRPNPITVLFFARPSLKWRGYELGVKALRLLKEQRPNVKVLFFGANLEDLGEVPFDFDNLGVLSADELCKILNRAHILLSFSLSNISWVPYEGMACGCAVVEAKVPSVVEMVSPGHNCLLADPEPEAVAAALQRLVADTTLRCQLANQAAEELRHRTWQHFADQFEEILRHRCFVRLDR